MSITNPLTLNEFCLLRGISRRYNEIWCTGPA
jgi:hypothetical protein